MKEIRYKATDTGSIKRVVIDKETPSRVFISGEAKVKVTHHSAYFKNPKDAHEWAKAQIEERMRCAHRHLGTVRESYSTLKESWEEIRYDE